MHATVDWDELYSATRALVGVATDDKVLTFLAKGEDLFIATSTVSVKAKIRLNSSEIEDPGDEGYSLSGNTLLAALQGYSSGATVDLTIDPGTVTLKVSQHDVSNAFSTFWLDMHPDEDPVQTSFHRIPTMTIPSAALSELELLTPPEATDTIQGKQFLEYLRLLKPFVVSKASFSSASQIRFEEYLYLITDSLGIFIPNPFPLQGFYLEHSTLQALEKILPKGTVSVTQKPSLTFFNDTIILSVTRTDNKVDYKAYLEGIASQHIVQLPPSVLTAVIDKIPSSVTTLVASDEGTTLEGADDGIGSSRASFAQTLPFLQSERGSLELPTDLLKKLLPLCSDNLLLHLARKGTSWAATFKDPVSNLTLLTQLYKVELKAE